LLFQAYWTALRQRVRAECGIEPAATMVLHTWNQRLEHHPHVHAIVPGSGPSLDGLRWVPCRLTKGTGKKLPQPFLVDNQELGRAFRHQYIGVVRRLLQSGELKVQGLAELEASLSALEVRDWVVFIQPPPTDSSNPEDVVKYLARYMTGGPISNSRLIEVQDDRVWFWARSKDKSGRKIRCSLSTMEFMRNWCIESGAGWS
jgi:Putative transposase